jgi:hypothetical protein
MRIRETLVGVLSSTGFSLWIFDLAWANPRRLKPVLRKAVVRNAD